MSWEKSVLKIEKGGFQKPTLLFNYNKNMMAPARTIHSAGCYQLLVLCFLALIAAGCESSHGEERISDTNKTGISPTAPLDPKIKAFGFENSRAACGATSECILMRVGGCDNVQAIHLSQVELAKAYTAAARKANPNVQCAPDLPIEDYESLCLNHQCRAEPRKYRLLLEVPEQPVAGVPFWVGIGFRFPEAARQVDAHILLPDRVKVIRGQADWSGPVEAFEDHVIWVQVQTDATGEITLSGWAGIQQAGNTIPPLNSSQKITVMVEQPPPPRPVEERILATPTPLHP